MITDVVRVTVVDVFEAVEVNERQLPTMTGAPRGLWQHAEAVRIASSGSEPGVGNLGLGMTRIPVHVDLDQIDHLKRPPRHWAPASPRWVSKSLIRLEDHTRCATHVAPMGNYVIAGVGNYVIENPSNLGNYVIADTCRELKQNGASPVHAGRSS
jgi:hypothetical protein